MPDYKPACNRSMDGIQPLDDLERFELLQAMFPGLLHEDADLGDEEEILDELGVDPEVFDELMARAVLCAMPMQSPLSGQAHHVLGQVSIADGQINMMAAVKREIIKGGEP